MLLSILIFIMSLIGFIFYNKNIILAFIYLELILLGINLLLLRSSLIYDNLIGCLFALIIILLAGIESAIGLTLLINFYRIRGVINWYDI